MADDYVLKSSDLTDILVVPNPYKATSAYESVNFERELQFHNLPEKCVIRIYNTAGEMIYLERDSLSYEYYFKKFMEGSWIMEKMTIDEEIIFEMDTIFNPENSPNIYTFSNKHLKVSGPQYSADYNIEYKDSSQVELEGKWIYGVEGEGTYRTKRIYNIQYFQILSYYNFLWTNFINDTEKEEEVLFRRINFPVDK